MDDLIPHGTAAPYRLDEAATGYRLFCISNALWPPMSGCLSDNLLQFTPEAEELLTLEVLTLSSSLCLEEIVNRLDAILAAIRSLDVCCVLSQGNPGLDEEPYPLERGVGDPPVGEDWEAYDAYLCQALQRQVDLVEESLDALTDGLGVLGVMGLDALALYLAPCMPPVALLLALLGVLATILEDELYDQWSGELANYANDAICAGYLAYTPGTAKDAIDAVIEQYVTPAPNILLHQLLWSQSQLNRIFSGEFDDLDAYDPDYCLDCEAIPLEEWHFDGGLEGWFLYDGKWESELTYNAEVTHTEDGTGCAQLYLDDHWYGQWFSYIQVNTNVLVVSGTTLEFWHSMSGDVRDVLLTLVFDDETDWSDDTIGLPFNFPEWKYIAREVPEAHIGKTIVAVRLGWEGNNDYVYLDDVRLFVSE